MTALLTFDQVAIRQRRKLWDGFLYFGEGSMFVAEGGTGKGLAGARMARYATTGDPWPGEPETARRDPMTVITITPEDDNELDMRGRLDAAGADVRYVVTLSHHEDGRPWKLTDLPELVRLIKAVSDPGNDEYAHLPVVGMVLLDPLTKLLGDKQNISSRSGANAVMGSVQAAAKAADVSIPVMHHTNWDGGVNGSRALLDSLKLCFRIDKDPEAPGQRVITAIKTNITPGGGMKYKVLTAANGFPYADFFVPAEERAAAMAREADQAAALAAMGPLPPAEPAPVPHRTACLVDRPGSTGPERSILGESGSMPAARRLAQDSAYGYGVKLVWETRPDGMQTAARILPGGGTVKFAAYLVAA